MIKRLWKFAIETDNGAGYLLSTGELVHDRCATPNWIGSDAEAEAEAERRAAAAEGRPGPFITRVVYESQCKVRSSAKTGQEEFPF